MKKTSTRLLSMLLAVMMVLTMVPVLTLGADAAPATTPEPAQTVPVWDGTLPTDANGVTGSITDWLTGAEYADKILTYESWDAISDDLELNGKTLSVKSADGYAILVVLSAHNTKIGDDLMISTSNSRAKFFNGKTITLETDIYLNSPEKEQKDWTNESMPLFWGGLEGDEFNNADFVFDGKGHIVYGFKVDQTIEYRMNNRFSNGWGFFGSIKSGVDGVEIKNLALVGATMDIDATVYSKADDTQFATQTAERGGVCTVLIGGMVGQKLNNNKLEIHDCVIDISVNLNVAGAGTYYFGGRPASVAAIGGVFSFADGVEQWNDDGSSAGRISKADAVIIRDMVVSVNLNAKTGANTWWEQAIQLNGLCGGGYYAVPSLRNIVMLSASVSATGSVVSKTPFVGGEQGSLLSGRYGFVLPFTDTGATNTKYKDTWFCNQTIDDVRDNFARYQVKIDDERTAFGDWVTNDDTGMVALPNGGFSAEATKFIDTSLLGAYFAGTAEELLAFKDVAAAKKRLILTADIDMAGKNWIALDEWSGTIDGDGHIIYNLTTDNAANSPAYTGSWGDAKNARGGIVHVAGDGFTIKDIAFVNMYNKTNTYWADAHCGMIWGRPNQGASVKAENVLIIGSNNNANHKMGYFGGWACKYSSATKVEITNCAFINNGTGGYLSQFACATYETSDWQTGTAIITDTYVIDPITTTYNAGLIASKKSTPVTTYNNVYIVGGSVDRVYYTYNNGANKITIRDCASEVVLNRIGDATIVDPSVLYGTATGFDASAWRLADNVLPIPAVFGAKAKTLAEIVTYGQASPEGVFYISSATDLDEYVALYNAGTKMDAKLMGDIFYNETVSENGKMRTFAGINDFANTFDGNGYAIYGLFQKSKVSGATANNIGFINNVSGTATIKNVVFLSGLQIVERSGAILGIVEEAGAYKAATGDAAQTIKRTAFGGLVGLVGANLTVENVFSNNEVLVRDSSNVEYYGESTMFAAGLLGYIEGNVTAKSVQYVGALTVDMIRAEKMNVVVDETLVSINGAAPVALTQAVLDAWKAGEPALSEQGEQGKAMVGAFYAQHYSAKTTSIVLEDAFFFIDIAKAGLDSYDTFGLAGVQTAPGSFSGTSAPADVNAGIHKYTNVYVTSTTESNSGGYGNHKAYKLTTDGTTVSVEYVGVEEARLGVDSDTVKYYGVYNAYDIVTDGGLVLPEMGDAFVEGFAFYPILASVAESLKNEETFMYSEYSRCGDLFATEVGVQIRPTVAYEQQHAFRLSFVFGDRMNLLGTEWPQTLTMGVIVVPTAVLQAKEMNIMEYLSLDYGTEQPIAAYFEAEGTYAKTDDEVAAFLGNWDEFTDVTGAKQASIVLENIVDLLDADQDVLTAGFTVLPVLLYWDEGQQLYDIFIELASFEISIENIAKTVIASGTATPEVEASLKEMLGLAE